MTRIIAGRAGSLVLDVPDAGTRPTSDRVRESVFGALEAAGAVEQARVLDLYAGSGALGLEALSRGAASVDLVEKAARAAAVARRNVDRVEAALGAVRAQGPTADAAVRVHRMSADAFLRSSTERFELVFVDPPYGLTEAELATTLGLLVPRLADGADVVIERGARSPDPTLPVGLVIDRVKRYGDTAVWWVVADTR